MKKGSVFIQILVEFIILKWYGNLLKIYYLTQNMLNAGVHSIIS